MPTFSADEIINKSLIAKVPINIYRNPSLNSEIVYTAKTGQTVGVVYSYLMKNDGLWWQMYDSNKKPYYVKHGEGKFSVSSLREQGVLTTKEREEKKIEENKSFGDKLGDTVLSFAGILKWVLIAAIIGLLLYYANESGLLKKMMKK